jgi:hypothetical protein
MLFSAYAQEEELTKNLLTGAFGYSFVPKGGAEGDTEVSGVLVPSIGLDYFRRVSPKWEVGTMIDLELSDYLIIEKNLNRSKALVITGIAAYNFIGNWTVFGGLGVELEKHKNFMVTRFGAEHAFKFDNNWLISPGCFYDIKEGYDTWSISVAFGKEF